MHCYHPHPAAGFGNDITFTHGCPHLVRHVYGASGIEVCRGLTRHGFRVAVMKADAVAPNRREAWVADKVKQGIDVMTCHPRLVQTGLDLIDFPTIVWDETEFSVFQSTQKKCGSHGRPIWMQLGLHRQQRAARLQTSHHWWNEEHVSRSPCGFKHF